MISMDAQRGGAPLTAEQVRDNVSRLLQGVNASDPRELAGELFREDGEFSELLLRSIPRLIAAFAEGVKDLAASLESMPEEKSAELLSQVMAQIDGKAIGEAMNAYNRLVIRLYERDPELYSSGKMSITASAMETLDFGQLRKSIMYRARDRIGFLREEIGLMEKMPIALLNLFSILAPTINDILRLLKETLEGLNLANEAMAYAVFKILKDLHWGDLAQIINGAGRLVVGLHRGNLLLGNGSMESRSVFAHIGEGLLPGIEPQVLAETIAAIGEEGEALVSAFADTAFRSEELTLWTTDSFISLANSYLRAASNVLEKAGSLPPQTIKGMAENLAQDFEVAELGRAIQALVTLGGRLGSESPGLYGSVLKKALSSIEVGGKFKPDAIGESINSALDSYNLLMREKPLLVEETVDSFLKKIDPRRLGEAAAGTASGIAAAASRNPEMARAVFKAAFSIIRVTARDYIRNAWKGRRKLRGVRPA